jgi:type IV pilus assembly protein PilB
MQSKTHVPNAVMEKLSGNGFFSKERLEQAFKTLAQSSGRRSLSDILINDLGYDRHAVMQKLCEVYAFREIKLNPSSLSEGWLKFIKKYFKALDEKNKKAFIEQKIVPFGYSERNRDVLIFITPDPTVRRVAEILHQAGVVKFELAYAKLEEVNDLLTKTNATENEYLNKLKEASDEISLQKLDEDEKGIDEDELNAAINKSLLVNLFEAALIESVRRGSSDIHIIPREHNQTDIYFRVDGRLQLWHRQDSVKPEAFLAVVKDRTKNVDRFEWETAQDGFIQRQIDNYTIRYRVSILPIVSTALARKYESVVIRVLDDRKVITDLEKLGFDDYAKQEFVKAITKPQGMVILTGPTGSGKSTTLVAALSQVMTPELNILTVEDPVEYNIRGARQLKLGAKMNFDQAIRSILRHDPDIVMVGEIRDAKTAEIAIKLANTGHLTFSTVHTNDAASVVSRLYKMGIEPFLIAYAINLVVAQRLIRMLCKHCKKPIEKLDPAIPLSMGFTEEEVANTQFYHNVGCPKCRNGYAGRSGIHEVLTFTNPIRRLIFEAKGDVNEEAIRDEAVRNGMSTLRAAARRRAKLGQTSLEEVAAVTTE